MDGQIQSSKQPFGRLMGDTEKVIGLNQQQSALYLISASMHSCISINEHISQHQSVSTRTNQHPVTPNALRLYKGLRMTLLVSIEIEMAQVAELAQVAEVEFDWRNSCDLI